MITGGENVAAKGFSSSSAAGRKAQIARFVYNGVPIHKLTPVTHIKDLREQMQEIESRIEAMAAYCDEHGLVMTPLHIRNALALTDNVYKRLLNGKYNAGYNHVDVEYHKSYTDEQVALFKEIAALLQRWEALCNQFCLDSVATDNQFGRGIYMSKAIFHNWDTPQSVTAAETSIEVLLGKANRIKVKLAQAEQAAKKSEKKGDGAW